MVEGGNTVQFTSLTDTRKIAHEIIMQVYIALKEKGYDPITQLVGYLISGDPTYITSYKGARGLISRLERDEILEEIVAFYVIHNSQEK